MVQSVRRRRDGGLFRCNLTKVVIKMARVPFCRLKNGLEIRRILNGMWQVSGSHGPINPNKASREMFKYYDAGLTTFDMADIYGPAEDIFGDFLEHLKAERGEESAGKVQGELKIVTLGLWIGKKYTQVLHFVLIWCSDSDQHGSYGDFGHCAHIYKPA